jgi:hypothetical protein
MVGFLALGKASSASIRKEAGCDSELVRRFGEEKNLFLLPVI